MKPMSEFTPTVDEETHRKLAVDLFHLTWELMEKTDRTQAIDNEMIHAAHASRYHWGIVGTPLNFARGEWLISRVYSVVGRPEPALYHAKLSLDFCLEEQLGNFDLGFAYEALARAYGTQGDLIERNRYIELATQSAERVTKQEVKSWLLKNISTVESLSLPRWEQD
ncbi:MAG: hypothetical protein K6T81_00200 [Alicyclobacillus macrosporangiidus]|uniref:hypothetical protein n=1 Tax=Alicyclobacillus macrosporangiidus TaxID=392015 RepID=UPI0026F06AED|nr:hypothetical protein [Alicyclobacillus macrosporangiidus]MCL6597143.1 hypothetical protein [Alicyclobacillus macrosporangiidus]